MRTAISALSMVLLLAASAQAAQLVKNINEQPQPTASFPADSFPTGFVTAGDRIYFSATTASTGREYFWVDANGGPAQLLADIAPGALSSSPSDLIQLENGLLVFVAEHPSFGRELWVSDGTSSGTQLLADLTGPGATSNAQDLVVHQGLGYFLARLGSNFSLGLWRTDGTTTGTVQIEDLGLTGSYSADAQMLVSAGSQLFYTTSESISTGGPSVGQWRLYVSDGTAGGATLVTSVQESSWFGPRELTAAGSRAVWVAQGIDTGLELWFSDGTPAGTGVADLMPGPLSSLPSELTVVGDKVFFSAYTNGILGEVFVSDGTALGTYQVTSSTANGRPVFLAAFGDRLAYMANDGVHGNELWVTGSARGSETLYADFVPGPVGSDPSGMFPYQGGLVCTANHLQFGRELFFSDGTEVGTYLVADLNPGVGSSGPHGFTPLGSKILFAATNPQFGSEPWVTDGTAAGTQVHTDLAPVPFDQSSNPRGFAHLGDRVVFTADDGLVGPELWVSDGTAAGTVRLTNFPGTAVGIPDGPPRIQAFDGRALFMLNDGVHGSELWISDGTPGGTQLLFDAIPGPGSGNPFPMIEWRGELYFAAGSSTFSSYNLYATDGTKVGTRLVFAFSALGGAVHPSAAVVHQDRLYFAARTPATGTELWSSDGTTLGTSLVADIFPGLASSMSQLSGASLGEFLYFGASSGGNSSGLWRSDGTALGTSLFAEIHPSIGAPIFGANPGGVERIGRRVVFSSVINSKRQYFGTDGVSVRQLSYPPLGVNASWKLYSNGEKLIGMLRGANGSFELWGTDGTPAGSGVIQQIQPDGSQFVNLRAWRVSSGPKLLFAAGNSSVGHELFLTDGTDAGTGVLVDLVPGPEGSFPEELIRLGDGLLFSAREPAVGWELYRLPWSLVDDWLAEPFGVGCAGANGMAPSLTVKGSAKLGATLTVTIAAAALAPVVHFWSANYGFQDLEGCSIYLSSLNFLAGGATDAVGSAGLPLHIPNTPSLIGTGLWMQSLVVDPGAELLGLAALTPALEIRFGN